MEHLCGAEFKIVLVTWGFELVERCVDCPGGFVVLGGPVSEANFPFRSDNYARGFTELVVAGGVSIRFRAGLAKWVYPELGWCQAVGPSLLSGDGLQRN